MENEEIKSDRVRADHVVYLIESSDKLNDEEKKKLVQNAISSSFMQRNHALLKLDELHGKGTVDRLRRLWADMGRGSLFLFAVPGATDISTETLKPAVLAALKRSNSKPAKFEEGKFYTVESKEQTEDEEEDADDVGSGETVTERLHKVAVANNQLTAVVRMTRSRRYFFEEEEKTFSYTYDVRCILDFKNEDRLTQVFGAQADGKKSLRTLLGWLLDEKIPQRAPGLNRFIEPVKFTEAQIKSLMVAKKYDLIGMSGADSQGVIGRIGYEGKVGTTYNSVEPLDLNDRRIKQQNAAPQEMRAYNFRFTHEIDDFPEVSQVQFNFGKRQQRMSFPARATKPAMEAMITLVYERVRAGP